MIFLVLALDLDLKMSSNLTSICHSGHSDSPPFVLYGAGVFDNLTELSEESMAPTEIWDINKTYDGFKSVRVIEQPCINCQRKGIPCVESATASSSWANIGGSIKPQGNPIGVAPEVPILVTRKDGKLGKLERNLVVQDEIDTDAEGSDEIDREELQMTTPIQKRRIQASTTNNEVIRSPNHLNFQQDPQLGHPNLPLPLPVSNPLLPALPETQCLQNLNQSLKPVSAGI
ncbi:hypothetical protein O181_108444 [Austropuccinia psidii MF-1]|uniref:Prolactin receptor n=1 Tax=Austropuccinia psidii MF-1 TaxID=1389203 RepID=A0A9Q3PNY8_9BASI|nr:hypothetical protein [Austropuccinia psidii MF-1]